MCQHQGPSGSKAGYGRKQSYVPRHQEEEEVSVGWWPIKALGIPCYVVVQLLKLPPYHCFHYP